MQATEQLSLVEGMARMKVRECIDDGRFVIRRESRSKFRIAEVGGDWIASGSMAAIAARYLVRAWK